MIFRLLLLISFLFGQNLLFAQDNKNCLWGTNSEKTTYQVPYSPLLGPKDIPVINQESEKGTFSDFTKTAISPETAIKVATSDGNVYSYYYRETVQYRKFVDYQWVFEPKEEIVAKNVSIYNPCSGQYEWATVQESVLSAFPVWHEKAFYRYEPVKVRQKIIIPGSVSPETSTQPAQSSDGSASSRLQTDVIE
ncbi:MAG: hypothetical protein Q4C95_06790 [Planctomycetia bacterium]|nr:hypothetical protein [Planctomycetia bacterium]